mmetsp:Transcript_3720/g.8189  ORF Transcript_3720/g.8189 Transcript_3720/m.8189 type:complete len:131 (-) Transcript_3720:335-727(-)
MARSLVLLVALFGSAAAFSTAPSFGLRTSTRSSAMTKIKMYSPVPSPTGTKETYWETKAPGSEVLGIGKSVPSNNYAAFSIISALVGAFSIQQAWPLTADPNPLFIAGSFFLPYSWALHVAAWIQKNNGK